MRQRRPRRAQRRALRQRSIEGSNNSFEERVLQCFPSAACAAILPPSPPHVTPEQVLEIIWIVAMSIILAIYIVCFGLLVKSMLYKCGSLISSLLKPNDNVQDGV